jgi:hypothetical protein
MKDMFLKYAILFIIILNVAACAKDDGSTDDQQDPPTSEPLAGGNFDEWVEIIQGDVTFMKPAGGWWGSLNTLSFIGGPITVSPTADAFEGEFAARLETKKWGEQLTIPGILASGYFDKELPMGENLVVGQPFDRRPAAFTGYYKYAPAGSDSLVILIALTKYDLEGGQRDTLVQANYVTGEESQSYRQFSLNLDYAGEALPDSIHIILLSSIKGQQMQGFEGSVLKVDELSLTYD